MSRPLSEQLESTHIQRPATEFYWAVIDATTVPSRFGRIRNEQLGYLFEQSLPLPIEEVHAIYARIGKSKRFVACGIERTRLNDEIQCEGCDVQVFTPLALPEWMDELAAAIPPARFNLLTGTFEPSGQRATRRRLARELMAAALILIGVLVVGFERRIAAAEESANAVEVQRAALLQEILAESTTPAGLPLDVRLTAELRTLRQTRTNDEPAVELMDASNRLTTLLNRWPKDVHLRTQSLSVTADSMTLRGLLESVESSQAFVDALGEIESWRVPQPSVRSTRDGIDMELRLLAAKDTLP